MLWRLALAALSGILLTLLYPPFSFAPLGWFALTPLILALTLSEATAGQGLLLGWVTGTIGGLGVTGHWMYHAAHDYFAMSSPAAALFTVAVNQIFVSLYFTLFGLGASLLRTRRPLLIAALFVATEYARAHVLGGNPWAQLGQSQDFPILMQVCDLAGTYGLTFLLAFSAAALAAPGRRRAAIAQALALVALTLAYGSWRLKTAIQGTPLPVVLVQGALPNTERGDPRFFARHLQSYADLTSSVELPQDALVVWPENAVGFFPAENASLLAPVREVLAAHHASLLFGAPRGAGREGVAAIYNAAYVARGDAIESVYDKRVLLPFVESMPLRREDGPYLSGERRGSFMLGSTKLGVLICYEAIYAAPARELARDGVQVLVNLSNDSWFDAGAGPEQHFLAAKFRAVENHMSLLRVTNSGVSGVVDANGREIIRLPSKRPAARLVAVPPGEGGSFYSRYGDVFAAACVVLIACTLANRLRS